MLKSMPIRVIADDLLMKYNSGNNTLEEQKEIYMPTPFKEGMFMCYTGNFEHNAPEDINCISDLTFYLKENKIMNIKHFNELTIPLHSKLVNESDLSLESYGVCDNFEQVLELYHLEDLEDDFTIAFSPMHKKHQPQNGGWRWHKWGQYIGNQESFCEYLYDEPNIELIYVYHIYKWSKKDI